MTQHLLRPAFAAIHHTSDDDDEPGASDVLDKALARVARVEMSLAACGGALHDVNNLLTVLSGHLYLMTEDLRTQPDILSKSRSARNTAERASSLIRELLSAARDTDDTVTIICPARHAVALQPVLRRSIASVHRFRVRHSPDPWRVAASASQLESAIANLVINAHEALSRPGKIDVKVENTDLDSRRAQSLGLTSGRFVRVSVIDTGAGIAKAQLPQVMRALVTSKPAGQGSGMGLAMVKRFACQVGGTVNIDSVEGRGTRVDLWLPQSMQQADATANMTLPLSTLPAGDETILLLSQDAEVCGMIEQLLKALGYTVIEANTQVDALSIVQSAATVSAVIWECSPDDPFNEHHWSKLLRQHQPEIRQLVIVSAGENRAEVAPDADAYLTRPISIAELATSLRAVLEATPCR